MARDNFRNADLFLDLIEDDTQDIICNECGEHAVPCYDVDTGTYEGSNCCGAK